MHETQRDFEYFKSMYPAAIKGYQAKVEAVCDRMEYEGSPMYDEYPDRVMLDRICRQICQDIERESAAAQNPLSVEEFERVETYELGGNAAASPAGRGRTCPDCGSVRLTSCTRYKPPHQ